jgi:tyrosyl-tRNA synthetase
MRDAGLPPQVCITLPLIPGLDGVQKMSKSLGNAIGLTDSPREQFGRTMSVPDDLMPSWFRLLTDLPAEQIEALLAGPPRDAKAALAAEIVAAYHGREAADGAAAEFDRIFRERGLPDEVPETALPADLVEEGRGVWLVRALQHVGLAPSASEARRLIKGGGVKVDEERVADDQHHLLPGGRYLVQVGKRRFHRIRVP